MRKLLLGAIAAATVITGALAQTTPQKIKTRLDHLAGTPFVLVVSYLPSEITSITCDNWVMLGINSWNHQNDFTIPGRPVRRHPERGQVQWLLQGRGLDQGAYRRRRFLGRS